jgi:hypothetical protein
MVNASMSTAIVRIFTPEGFVIASDGRKTRSEDHVVLSDSEQKIFPAPGHGNQIAYGIAGAVHQTAVGSDVVLFDFVAEAEEAARSIASRKCRDLAGYAVRLCRPIHKHLVDGLASGRIPFLTSDSKSRLGGRGNTIATLLFVGFLDGIPYHVRATFFTVEGRVPEPAVETLLIEPGKPNVYGPSEVYHLMFETEDQRLSEYRRPMRNVGDIDLTEAIEIAKNYIRACSDPQFCDTEECRGVGGLPQIATITRESGFQWVPVAV